MESVEKKFHNTLTCRTVMKIPALFLEKRIITVFMLAIVMATGFYIRFDDFGYWQENRDEFFFKKESLPVVINPDAYYYIDIADEYLTGKIRKIDERRRIPNSFQKPISLPLLSFILAFFSKLTSLRVEWIAIFLPVFCGITLAIPLYFLTLILFTNNSFPLKRHELFSHAEAKAAGLIAGLFGLLSPFLVKRTSVGWCDTDMLHTSFATISAMLAFMMMKADSQRKIFTLLVAALTNLFLFIWWWDFAFMPAFFLGGFPWLIALVMVVLSDWKERKNIFLLISSAVIVLAFSMLLFSNRSELLGTFQGLSHYLFEVQDSSPFPIAAQYVSEQDDVDFQRLAADAAGGTTSLVLSLIGLALLFLLARNKVLVFLPLFVVGALSTYAIRFLIFTAPLFGLGGAVLVMTAWKLTKERKIGLIVAGLPLALLFYCAFQEAQKQNFSYPRTKPALFEGMKEFAGDIAEDGIIWASWGHGHPLVHYTKKKTIGDGTYHPGSLLYIQNFPLATNNYRLSANWISFFAQHGEKGLRKANILLTGSDEEWDRGMLRLQYLLAAGPKKSKDVLFGKYKYSAEKTESLLAFLFPAKPQPLYLLLDYIHLQERWYIHGKWDLANSVGPNRFTQFWVKSIMVRNNTLMGKSNNGDVWFDLKNGWGKVGNIKVRLNRLIYEYGPVKKVLNYSVTRHGFVLFVSKNAHGEFCLITDNSPSESVFLKLFFEKNFDQNYFRPVSDKSPLYLLSEVKGDRYVPQKYPTD